MLCLKCSLDNSHAGPQCSECQSWIGHVAENHGYLPQLAVLQEQLEEGLTSSGEARERLQRLEQALLFMLSHLREAQQKLAALGMEQGVGPVVEGVENLLAGVKGLEPAGGWSDEQWERLRQAQQQVVGANSSMVALAEKLSSE